MVRVSLRTTDSKEAKTRRAEAAKYFDALWQNLRATRPMDLTHRQCVSLSGDVFRAWMIEGAGLSFSLSKEGAHGCESWTFEEAMFLPAARWGDCCARLADFAAAHTEAELEASFGKVADELLQRRQLFAIGVRSRGVLLREILRASQDACSVRRRQAEGDYSPAPEERRFPEWQAPGPPPAAPRRGRTEPGSRSADKLSLVGLVDCWWLEAKAAGRAQATHTAYRATVSRFVALLGHDDARAVTAADVLRYKDARLAEGKSLGTVKDSDLSGLRAIFAFAVGNGLLPSNPAEGVKVLRPKQAHTRAKGFTPEEATAILAKALRHAPAANEKPTMAAAKRWVPWLCAYTGARVGELVQLRKEDVREVDGLWTIAITPEAGTVKDKRARLVVLHPHIVEQGFPAFAAGSKSRRLFLAAKSGTEDIRAKWQAAKNRLAEFAREVVPDERVAPNHGWRHLFKTRGREAGVADSVLDAICGHAPGTVGGAYGDVSLTTQGAAMARMPRFEVG